jgi:GMP synthase-like glutamine amidotransferase
MLKNNYTEIGWFPVFTLKQASSNVSLLEKIPETFNAFHWHGDTFNSPEDAKRLFSSEAGKNQGFIYKDRIIGL